MADGARTHDHWNHNPGLYQLSYSHRSIADKLFNTFTSYLVMTPILKQMVRPAGLEPATIRLEGGCSIQLSYGRILEVEPWQVPVIAR